jgi:WD40 repeat protein
LISGYFGGTIILWNMDFSLPLGQSHSGPPVGFNIRPAFSPDVRIIASSEASTIYLSNVTTGQEINRFFTDYGDIDAIAFSPDGTTLAVANQDKSIALLDVKTGQIIGQPLLGHKGIVTSISFSPDGNKLASVSYDDAIILWDVDSHLPIDSPLSEKAWIAAFSPNGKFLATSGGTTIILWDLSKHPPLGQSLTGHENSVNSLTFSPDGKTLASGSQDATIRFWDVTTGTQIDQLFPEQNEPIYSIAFSPDGKILASVNTDYTISLWDISTSQPFGIPLAGHTWDVYGIAFSTDGKTLVSGSIDGTIILWDFDPESWLQKTCQRAGRNLTRTEWELYGFTETYHPTCQQWPLEPAEITTPIITPTSITNATSTP